MSISSSRLTIQRPLPWSIRLLIVILAGLIGAAAMRFYDADHDVRGRSLDNASGQLGKYKERVEQLAAERDQFSSTVNSAESRLNIERSAQRQLAQQVRALESENVRLKEDLAFFESLLPNAAGSVGVSIRRLKIDPVTPNQLRYRLLIMQGGKGDQNFVGSLQLVVTTIQGGKNAMMTFPDLTPAEQAKFKLSFKHYQRVEGVLTLPDGVAVKLVQARVLDRGQTRAQQSVNL